MNRTTGQRIDFGLRDPSPLHYPSRSFTRTLVYTCVSLHPRLGACWTYEGGYPRGSTRRVTGRETARASAHGRARVQATGFSLSTESVQQVMGPVQRDHAQRSPVRAPHRPTYISSRHDDPRSGQGGGEEAIGAKHSAQRDRELANNALCIRWRRRSASAPSKLRVDGHLLNAAARVRSMGEWAHRPPCHGLWY